MKKMLLPALVFTLSFPMLSCAASFDCAKATSWTEQMICGDAPLSKMDDQIAVSYKQAFEVVIDKNMLKTTQLEWIKKQRTCQDVMCLRDLYDARSDELHDLIIKATPSTVGKSDGSVAEPVKNSSESPVKKLLTFKLVYGEPLPLCQPYVDMLNEAKYVGYSDLACERKILPQFSQFKTVKWTEITDKNEIENILEERIKVNIAPLRAPDSYIREFNYIVKLIHKNEAKMYFFKHDLDRDGSEDIAYRLVALRHDIDESKTCKYQHVNYFDDKKTNVENAKQRYPGPYLAFQLNDDEIFYFKDAVYSSSWGNGIISADSNLDIYAVGNKKICGILAQ